MSHEVLTTSREGRRLQKHVHRTSGLSQTVRYEPKDFRQRRPDGHGGMFQRIEPRWQRRIAELRSVLSVVTAEAEEAIDEDRREYLNRRVDELRGQVQWMGSTIIELVISEAQNEIRDFQKWGFNIIPHRMVMKTGFQQSEQQRQAATTPRAKANLSQIDFEKLRNEFAGKVRRSMRCYKTFATSSSRSLAQMLARNPMRMDYYKKYQEIIADYNREKDRVTVEASFAQLVAVVNSLDAEQRRAAEEGLTDTELALFDLLFKENISKADRERLKQASKALLASLRVLLEPMRNWTQNEATQAEVKIFILDNLWEELPRPPFTEEETQAVAGRVHE